MTEQTEQCTCEDGFIDPGCPMHNGQEQQAQYGANTAIVDDTMLVAPTPFFILGNKFFMFVCPACMQNAIFHHNNFCPNCGLSIKIKSQVYSDFIRNKYKDTV